MIRKEKWGVVEGKEIYKYYLSNNRGMEVVLSNFGATMLNLFVNDCQGKRRDVVLGYNSLESYFKNTEYIGCTVAPNANRICKGGCEIDGVVYHLDINNGANNLHTHDDLAANKMVMDVEEKENELVFSCFFEDGRANLPGSRHFAVSFALNDDNELAITYRMNSDKKTLFNPTNHSYFNLNGHKSGNTFGHLLTIDADSFTPVDGGSIPTGEIRKVENTVFDFRKEKEVGKDFTLEDEQLSLTLGYDHNYVLNNSIGNVRPVACLKGEQSGIEMTVLTDMPGVQFYSSNYLNREDGKEGAQYIPHDGICLETQYYPDTINHDNFPSSLIAPNKEAIHQTVFRFK